MFTLIVCVLKYEENAIGNTSLFQSFIGNFGYAVLGAFIKLYLKEYNLYILGFILYI